MRTTAEDIQKYMEQQTRELEKSLERTGKTSRQVRRKRRQRIKYLVASTVPGEIDFKG